MDNQTVSKISFLGDIMCEKPFLKAAKARNLSFDGFLGPCKELFGQSELVVANLETPCDPESPLTKDMFVFNAPVSFVEEIRNSGINFVTTASNHALDRGLSGLKNTIHVLDQAGLKHTGTFEYEDQERFETVELSNGSKVAIASYTYGTNYMDNHVIIPPEDYYTINNLSPLFGGRNLVYDSMSQSLRARLTRLIPRWFRVRVNSALGRRNQLAFVDKLQDGDLDPHDAERISATIKKAHAQADLVVVCPHFGGQFNIQHGSYVDTFVDIFAEAGSDLVVGNHPHIAQTFEYVKNGTKVAYSLGNVSMSLSTPYVELANLPECSIMLHAYISNKKIEKMSFSILIEREDKGFISLHPLYDLYQNSTGEEKALLEKKNLIIYNRFLQKDSSHIAVAPEYVIEPEHGSETV